MRGEFEVDERCEWVSGRSKGEEWRPRLFGTVYEFTIDTHRWSLCKIRPRGPASDGLLDVGRSLGGCAVKGSKSKNDRLDG